MPPLFIDNLKKLWYNISKNKKGDIYGVQLF